MQTHTVCLFVCIGCRNLELAIDAHSVLLQVVTEQEAAQLANNTTSLMPSLRDGLAHAF